MASSKIMVRGRKSEKLPSHFYQSNVPKVDSTEHGQACITPLEVNMHDYFGTMERVE